MAATRALLLLALALPVARGFPDGAPVDACVKERRNQPYHGQSRPQPPHTFPYNFFATGSYYGPGSQIAVVVDGMASNTTFRGIMLQAVDEATNQWVGTWDPTPGTNGLPECSAVTHADNRDKLQMTLVWTAPPDTPGGQVYFTGAMVYSFSTFWVGVRAYVVDPRS